MGCQDKKLILSRIPPISCIPGRDRTLRNTPISDLMVVVSCVDEWNFISVSSVAERETVNLEVVGSIPTRRVNQFTTFCCWHNGSCPDRCISNLMLWNCLSDETGHNIGTDLTWHVSMLSQHILSQNHTQSDSYSCKQTHDFGWIGATTTYHIRYHSWQLPCKQTHEFGWIGETTTSLRLLQPISLPTLITSDITAGNSLLFYCRSQAPYRWANRTWILPGIRTRNLLITTIRCKLLIFGHEPKTLPLCHGYIKITQLYLSSYIPCQSHGILYNSCLEEIPAC